VGNHLAKRAVLANTKTNPGKMNANHVVLDPLQIPEPVLGQQHVLLVPLVCIRCRQTLLLVKRAVLANTKTNPGKMNANHVVLVPLPILEQVPGQQHVLLAPPTRIHYRRTLLHVRPALPVLLQILEVLLGQHRVIIVLLGSIRWMIQSHVKPVRPLPPPPLSNAPLV